MLGRVTHESMAAYWRTAQGEVADYMNGFPKVVRTCTLETADWNNATLAKGNVAGETARLKQQGNWNSFVFGSANLSKNLANEGLLDEYRLGIAPVIHGNRRLLFSGGRKPRELELLESRPHSTGCVILRYRRMA